LRRKQASEPAAEILSEAKDLLFPCSCFFLLLLLRAASRHSGLAAFGGFSWPHEMSGAYPITLPGWLHRCHPAKIKP
jgi:hypothetical protein